MKAVACHNGALAVVDIADPEPGPGQVLVEVTGCGICGSDLHARYHADAQADVLAEAGYHGFMRSHQQVIFGHEFVGLVADYGPGTSKRIPAGTAVVALPLRRTGRDMHAIGLSAAAPGGYAQQVLVEEAFMLAVPNRLPADVAVLTEPMAIAYHAVRRAQVTKKDTALVIGCGPVGLAVISVLKATGIAAVVASDYSPGRRALAAACGADIVVDPAHSSPFDSFAGRGFTASIPVAAARGLEGMRKLQRLPIPWDVTLRALDKIGGTKAKRPIIFECVGLPGIIDSIITSAPLGSRAVVVGVCMEPDRIRPVMAINKEIDLRFVVGYSPLEFRDTLHMLADGKLDATPLLTGTVGLDGVADAFHTLSQPGEHAKIVIDPASAANTPEPWDRHTRPSFSEPAGT